jgi:hypothetical protein
MQVWRTILVLSEHTSDSSALLNAMCLLKYVPNCEEHFFIFNISIRINSNRISEGLLCIKIIIKNAKNLQVNGFL